MAELKENFKTQAGSINQDGTRKITRSWYAIGYTDLDAADTAVVAAAGLSYTFGGLAVAFNGARSWSMVEGQGENVWLFTVEYSTVTSPPDSTDNSTAATCQGTCTATTRSVYRLNYDVTDTDNPLSGDIEGNPVDSGGTPTSIVWTGRRFETTTYYSVFPDINTWAGIVGTRNAAPYEGADTGTVLYLGFSFSYNASNQIWQVRHQFSVDEEFYHTQQVAKTDGSGKVLTELRSLNSELLYVAKHVYAIQPFAKSSFIGLPVFP